MAAYGMLAGPAALALSLLQPALFLVSGATLLLLFLGIYNAWDAVTYHVFVQRPRERESEGQR
jgi:ABC-type uncharacterized transport system YnjBCD permease subunit